MTVNISPDDVQDVEETSKKLFYLISENTAHLPLFGVGASLSLAVCCILSIIQKEIPNRDVFKDFRDSLIPLEKDKK